MGIPYVGSRTWERHTFFCDVCKKELPPGAAVFEPSGKFEHYCSMACARKALGVEADADLTGRCEGCLEPKCPFCPAACANYEPEAEPFDFPACPCVAVEAEPEAEAWFANYEPEAVPEAEVWSFGVNLSTRNTSNGYIRGLHATMPNGKQRVVLVHDAGFDIDGNDIALLQAAPQTAAKLKAAEATINVRDAEIRLLNGVCDRVVKAEAEADTLRDVLKTVREELRAMRHNVDCAIIANRDAIRVIDAALGQDGA